MQISDDIIRLNTSYAPHTRPTLLAVLAHPDDETFGIGGTLALYAQRGVDVHLICATGGELGDVASAYLVGYGSPAARRRFELEGAARILGLSSVVLLGYRDSGMAGTPANAHPEALAAAPFDEVVARVVAVMRRIRPHVVITFDPIGGYRHPDHLVMQRATVEAFASANDPLRLPEAGVPYRLQRLYFSTFSRRFLRAAVWLMPLFGRDPQRFGRNGDVDLLSIAVEDFPVHAAIDTSMVWHTWVAAGACHISQGGDSQLMRGPLGLLFRLLGTRERYMQAEPSPAPGTFRTDLFEGVVW
jgi:LmbE family N-acetylglucosaminyl deacetylase